MAIRIIKLPEVMRVTALSRSSIYDYAKKGSFPKPVPIGEKAVGWLESEVLDWIEARAKNRRGGI